MTRTRGTFVALTLALTCGFGAMGQVGASAGEDENVPVGAPADAFTNQEPPGEVDPPDPGEMIEDLLHGQAQPRASADGSGTCWTFNNAWRMLNRHDEKLYDFDFWVDWCTDGVNVTDIWQGCSTSPVWRFRAEPCSHTHSGTGKSSVVIDHQYQVTCCFQNQWTLNYYPRILARVYANGWIEGQVRGS